jgi:anthranilate phosphoribosyltransferase/anthranilate synthase/phosphoribosyltransferase
VLLNAGAALVVEGRTDSLAEGHALARASIDSGAAAGCFQRMKEASRGA